MTAFRGAQRAALAHKTQVEDVAVALTFSGEEGVSVLHEWQRAPNQREAKWPWWQGQRRAGPP